MKVKLFFPSLLVIVISSLGSISVATTFFPTVSYFILAVGITLSILLTVTGIVLTIPFFVISKSKLPFSLKVYVLNPSLFEITVF